MCCCYYNSFISFITHTQEKDEKNLTKKKNIHHVYLPYELCVCIQETRQAKLFLRKISQTYVFLCVSCISKRHKI